MAPKAIRIIRILHVDQQKNTELKYLIFYLKKCYLFHKKNYPLLYIIMSYNLAIHIYNNKIIMQHSTI